MKVAPLEKLAQRPVIRQARGAMPDSQRSRPVTPERQGAEGQRSKRMALMSRRSGPGSVRPMGSEAVPVAWPLAVHLHGPNASAAGARRPRIRMPGSNHWFLYHC